MTARARATAAAVALALVSIVPFTGSAGAVATATTQLRITDALTVDADDPVDHAVCLDGAPLADTTSGSTVGPFEVETATHRISFTNGHGSDCSDEGGVASFYVDLVDVQAQTVALYLEPGPNGPQPAVRVFEDDLSCPVQDEADSGLIIRNLATLWNGLELTDAISVAIDTELFPIGLLEDLPRGEQDVDEVPAGLIENLIVTVPPFDETAFEDADLDIPTDSLVIRTVYGGLIGVESPEGVLGMGGGSFDVTIPLVGCSDETPDPDPTPDPTPDGDGAGGAGAAQPATPVAARPSYTG